MQIATLAAFAVALLCFIAWLLRLNILVRLISESILVGFKAGAGLTMAASQLPNLLGVPGGGHNFFDRMVIQSFDGPALAGGIASLEQDNDPCPLCLHPLLQIAGRRPFEAPRNP
jgi:hypothetical protein